NVDSPAVNGGSIVNSASVTCTGIPAPVASNIVDYSLKAAPNLTVTKSSMPSTNATPAGSYTQVQPGDAITYRVIAKNLTPTASANILGAYVRDAIPSNTTYVTGSTYIIDPADAATFPWPVSKPAWIHVDDTPGTPALP